MIQANVEEDREATMAKNLHGLSRDIANVGVIATLCGIRGYDAHGNKGETMT